MIDAATLTGHSSFTGKTHAAAMASDGALEQLAVAAGLSSGEHVVPMVIHNCIVARKSDGADQSYRVFLMVIV